MNPARVVERLRKRSFLPPRVFLSDGSQRDIRHPELAVVRRDSLASRFESMSEGVARRVVCCAPLHVTHVESLSVDET